MQEQHPMRKIPLGLVAGFSAIALLTGAGTAFWTWTTLKPQESVITAPTEVEPIPSESASGDTSIDPSPQPGNTDPTQTPAAQTQAQIYWLQDTGTQFELVSTPVDLTNGESEDEILNAALTQLLQAQTSNNLATTIPADTQLLQAEVRSDGIYINLSNNFVVGGGSASMVGRLGQVLYTATSLDLEAPVWLFVAGEPLEVLGGEGLLVSQPLTRQIFEQDFDL